MRLVDRMAWGWRFWGWFGIDPDIGPGFSMSPTFLITVVDVDIGMKVNILGERAGIINIGFLLNPELGGFCSFGLGHFLITIPASRPQTSLCHPAAPFSFGFGFS